MNRHNFYHQLYSWYEQNHRVLPWRETRDPYRIWVSEIILQQTRVAQGMDYYLRFVERFPTVESLAAAEEAEVLRYWQGLGYYSRARNLYKGAVQIAHHPFPATIEALCAIPGVGDYTAGAIASFAYNLPYPALDGNVYRVLSRLYDCDTAFDTSAGKRHFHRLAEELLDRKNARLFNSAIMEFGALYCTPQSMDCEACPLRVFCEACAHHTAHLLPIRKPRPKIRERYLHYTVYLCPDPSKPNDLLSSWTLIHQREEKDIWYHLWEFPMEEHTTAEECKGGSISITHVLSHQRLHAIFEPLCVSSLPQRGGSRAVRLSELDEYALSRLTLRALETLFPQIGANGE